MALVLLHGQEQTAANADFTLNLKVNAALASELKSAQLFYCNATPHISSMWGVAFLYGVCQIDPYQKVKLFLTQKRDDFYSIISLFCMV